MYDYETEKPTLFTDEGQRLFLKIRDRAKYLLAEAGAARAAEIMSGTTGDSWEMMACVDRLVELGEIREIEQDANLVFSQHRVFVKATK